MRPTLSVGTFRYTSGADEDALEVVTVGVRLVEFVSGAVVIVGLAAVCAATCSAHVRETKSAKSARHAPEVNIVAVAVQEMRKE